MSNGLSKILATAVAAIGISAAPLDALSQDDVNNAAPTTASAVTAQTETERSALAWQKARERSDAQKALPASHVHLGQRALSFGDAYMQENKNGDMTPGPQYNVTKAFRSEGDVQLHLIYVVPPYPGTNEVRNDKAEDTWRKNVGDLVVELKNMGNEVMKEAQDHGAIIDKIAIAIAEDGNPDIGNLYLKVGDRSSQLISTIDVYNDHKSFKDLMSEAKKKLLVEFQREGHLIPSSEYGGVSTVNIDQNSGASGGSSDGTGDQGSAESTDVQPPTHAIASL